MEEQHDPERTFERNKIGAEHQTAMQAGADRARSSGIDPRELMSQEWLDTVNALDTDRNLPDEHPAQHNIEQKLGAHTSKQFGMGFLTHDEYRAENLKDRGRRRLMNSGYRERGGTGSKCTGRTRERMTGGEADQRPVMDADMSDQLDAAMEAKGMLRSGSVNGRRFKGSTEVQVVTRNDGGFELDDSSGGVLSRFTGGMLG
ncbi:MAG: hypothetical protein ACOCUO_01020 [archaeon]